AGFDFEARSSYGVRVRSTDAGGLAVEKDFTIAVTDVSEAPAGGDSGPPAGVPGVSSTARPLTAALIRKKSGKKARRFLRFSYADTGEVKQEMLSPFQRPRYRAIRVSTWDSDGDGLPDAAVVTARRGGKRFSRVIKG